MRDGAALLLCSGSQAEAESPAGRRTGDTPLAMHAQLTICIINGCS